VCVCCWCCPGRVGAEDYTGALLKKHGIGTTPDCKITAQAFLEERAVGDADLLRLPELVQQLGARQYAEREAAQKSLVRLDLAALPFVNPLIKSRDPEVARRATEIATQIYQRTPYHLPLVIVKNIHCIPLPQRLTTYLKYFPYAIEPSVQAVMVQNLLEDCKWYERAEAEVLLTYLADALPARRVLAVRLLGKIPRGYFRLGVPRFEATLKDADARVRLWAACELLEYTSASLPVLIELLAENGLLSWQAEDALRWYAGETAPPIVLNTTGPNHRARCKASWEQWFVAFRANQLPKKVQRSDWPMGLILAHRESKAEAADGCICIFGADGTVRWRMDQIKGLQSVQYTNNSLVINCLGFESRKYQSSYISLPDGNRTDSDIAGGKIIFKDHTSLIDFRSDALVMHIITPLGKEQHTQPVFFSGAISNTRINMLDLDVVACNNLGIVCLKVQPSNNRLQQYWMFELALYSGELMSVRCVSKLDIPVGLHCDWALDIPNSASSACVSNGFFKICKSYRTVNVNSCIDLSGIQLLGLDFNN
jgi:hypothetical protein